MGSYVINFFCHFAMTKTRDLSVSEKFDLITGTRTVLSLDLRQ